MKRERRDAWIALAVALLCMSCGDDDTRPVDMNVLIVGWDAVQRDHFRQCYDRRLADCPEGLPNIRELTNGRIVDITVTNGATDTKTGWTQNLTGYDAEITGVFNNSKYQPIAAGLSIFEKVKRRLGASNVTTLFIAGKTAHVGGACVGEPAAKGSKTLETLGQPWCLVKSKVDYFENGLGVNDSVGNKGLELLDTYGRGRFLAFFHFQEPDHAGHAHGENSSEYTAMIKDDDRWLGRLLDKLRELKIDKRTHVFVIVDHGFDEGLTSHANAPYVILGSNHPDVMRAGDRRDVAPTILEIFDVPDGQDGTPLSSGVTLTKRRSTTCIAEGGTVIDGMGEPGACPGLTVIGLARERPKGKTFECLPATGGTGDRSGYASACGDGACRALENRCNCPGDCVR